MHSYNKFDIRKASVDDAYHNSSDLLREVEDAYANYKNPLSRAAYTLLVWLPVHILFNAAYLLRNPIKRILQKIQDQHDKIDSPYKPHANKFYKFKAILAFYLKFPAYLTLLVAAELLNLIPMAIERLGSNIYKAGDHYIKQAFSTSNSFFIAGPSLFLGLGLKVAGKATLAVATVLDFATGGWQREKLLDFVVDAADKILTVALAIVLSPITVALGIYKALNGSKVAKTKGKDSYNESTHDLQHEGYEDLNPNISAKNDVNPAQDVNAEAEVRAKEDFSAELDNSPTLLLSGGPDQVTANDANTSDDTPSASLTNVDLSDEYAALARARYSNPSLFV